MVKARAKKRGAVTADRVIEEIAHAAFFDPLHMFNDDGTLKHIDQMPEGARRAIASFKVAEYGRPPHGRVVMKEVNLVKKESALTLVGRHLRLFTDRGDGAYGAAAVEVEKWDWTRLSDEELATLHGLMEKAAMDDAPGF